MIFVIDMLNRVHVYEGVSMPDALDAKNDYISDESIQFEVII